jgi:serine/threonine protein phosphatase PrpC
MSKVVVAPEETIVLLCSDGFLALASDYERYDADALLAACLSRGLKPLCDELRDIERGDREGRRFPRFKVSDDATAVVVRIKNVTG